MTAVASVPSSPVSVKMDSRHRFRTVCARAWLWSALATGSVFAAMAVVWAAWQDDGLHRSVLAGHWGPWAAMGYLIGAVAASWRLFRPVPWDASSNGSAAPAAGVRIGGRRAPQWLVGLVRTALLVIPVMFGMLMVATAMGILASYAGVAGQVTWSSAAVGVGECSYVAAYAVLVWRFSRYRRHTMAPVAPGPAKGTAGRSRPAGPRSKGTAAAGPRTEPDRQPTTKTATGRRRGRKGQVRRGDQPDGVAGGRRSSPSRLGADRRPQSAKARQR
jgi:hypothetical protein